MSFCRMRGRGGVWVGLGNQNLKTERPSSQPSSESTSAQPHVHKTRATARITRFSTAVHTNFRLLSSTALRTKLLGLLEEFPHPIVVLIDELDRVECVEDLCAFRESLSIKRSTAG
jgi:hypothetical protein